MTESFSELISWVTQKAKSDTSIPMDLDLIDEKILDSLTFVEFVLIIEELSGVEAVIGDDLVEKTRTLQRVKENFFDHKTV